MTADLPMHLQHLAKPKEPPPPFNNCGNCEFAQTVKEDLKVVECHGAPPTPAIMGMGPQGPAVGLLRPRLPRSEAACALHRRKAAILAG